jgi:hypothetical protein
VLVNVIAKEKKLGEKRTQFPSGGGRRSNSTQFHDDLVSVVEIFKLLCVVSDFNLAAPTQFA